MASSLSMHAAARPQARGAAHASPDGRATPAAGAMPHAGVMDSARMVAQRQRMAGLSGAASAVGGGTIQRVTDPSASGQAPGATPPASSQGSTQGSSSTDEDTGRRTVVIHYTGAAAMPKPRSQEPRAWVSDPDD